MLPVSFHRLARRELSDAAQYYDFESPGLGEAFLAEVERSLHAILEYPEAGLIVHGDVRRRLVRRFPYAVLYTVRSGGVRILAVMNAKRRPLYWARRK